MEDIEHMGFLEFLRKYYPEDSIIDLLNLDVEGAEYGLLQIIQGKPCSAD